MRPFRLIIVLGAVFLGGCVEVRGGWYEPRQYQYYEHNPPPPPQYQYYEYRPPQTTIYRYEWRRKGSGDDRHERRHDHGHEQLVDKIFRKPGRKACPLTHYETGDRRHCVLKGL